MKRQPKTALKCLGLRARVHIAILLLPRLFAGHVSLTQEMPLVAGIMQARSVDVMGSWLFDIDVLPAGGAAVRSFGDTSVPVTAALTDMAYDVVIVPAQSAPEVTLDAEEAYIADWLYMHYEVGVLAVGMSTVPLFIRAGLLDGRRATGLASERAWFARHFPNVHYTPDRPLAVDGRIITVSGVNPAMDVCAYATDYCRGAGVSQRVLRTALTQSLPSYEHMAAWTTQSKRHGDTAMLAIQEIVKRELAAPSTLVELAVQAVMSKRSLTRRFVVATGSNLRRHVATLRLGLAAFLLRMGRQSPDHVADECDYGSVSALNRVFSAGHGCSPLQYRAQRRTR